MKRMYTLTVVMLLAGYSIAYGADVVCTFPTANAIVTIKNYRQITWEGAHEDEPNFDLVWTDANGNDPEHLKSRGLGSCGGERPMVFGFDKNLGFDRNGKINRITISICDYSNKEFYPARLTIGTYDKSLDPYPDGYSSSKLKRLEEVDYLTGDNFDGKCQRSSLDKELPFSVTEYCKP